MKLPLFFAVNAYIALASSYDDMPTPYPTTDAPPMPCGSVSVCQDATYLVPGEMCSGSGDSPAGTECPREGDLASSDCHKYLKSWDEYDEICRAPEDAICQRIESGAWGCVFPTTYDNSMGCTWYPPTPSPSDYYPTPAPTIDEDSMTTNFKTDAAVSAQVSVMLSIIAAGFFITLV